MDQNFDYGSNLSQASNAGKHNEVVGSTGTVDRSDLVRNIMSLIAVANDQRLPFLMALLHGVAERLAPSPPVDLPREELIVIRRE